MKVGQFYSHFIKCGGKAVGKKLCGVNRLIQRCSMGAYFHQNTACCKLLIVISIVKKNTSHKPRIQFRPPILYRRCKLQIFFVVRHIHTSVISTAYNHYLRPFFIVYRHHRADNRTFTLGGVTVNI